MPPQIDFTEEAPIDFKAGGGIDFEEEATPEQAVRTGITAPIELGGATMAALESPAAGEASAEGRAQSAAERQRFLVAGGGPMAGLAVAPPSPVIAAAQEIPRVTAEALTGVARQLRGIGPASTGGTLPGEQAQRPLGVPEPPQFIIKRAEGGAPAELREMTPEEAFQREPIQAGRPLIPVRATAMEPAGSDAARLIANLSTPESIEMLTLGGGSKLAGMAILASMAPGVVEDVMAVAGSTASPEEKRDRINNLVLPALLMLRHGGTSGVPRLPEPLRRGRIAAPEIIDEPRVPGALPMTGAELVGRPPGFVPAVPTASAVELGPPAPPRVRRPEVPGESEAPQTRESQLDTIRKANAKTRDEIQKLFPEANLSREEAGALRDQAWAPPVVREVPPGSIDVKAIVPAIRLVGGKVIQGALGDTHPDIILREGIKAEDIDQRGFSDPTGQKFFLDREAAAKGTLAPTAREPGRLHSTDLPAAKAQETPAVHSLEQAHEGTPEATEGNVRVRVQMPDGTVRPALWNGYYEAEGTPFDKAPSVGFVVEGKWSHTILPEGAKILDPVPTFEEWKASQAPPTAVPAAHTGIEGTVIAGKTLAEWEAVKDVSGLPKGDARAELAKRLAVPNQPSRILQALANKKRTREILAPPAAPVTPAPPAESAAPPPAETIPAKPETITQVPATKPPEAEPVAAAKAETEVAKAASTQGHRPAQVIKGELISELEKAIEVAPSEAEKFPGLMENRKKGKFDKELIDKAKKEVGTKEIDIPGDGVFTILNTKEALGEVLKRVRKISTQPGALVKVSLSGLSKADKSAVQRVLQGLPEEPSEGSVGPGAASPAEFEQLPSVTAAGIDTGSHTWNVMKQRFRNFAEGMKQLLTRKPNKQTISQLANAADNLPRWTGNTAGNSIRLRADKPERQAVTFLMQAQKMSGQGISVEDAARLGELEHAGDPVGYLRTKQTDMETAAQQFLNEGKPLNAEAAKNAAIALQLARDKYNQLLPVAQRVKKMLDAQIGREARRGIDTDYERWYVPQRHDLDLLTSAEKPIVLGGSKAGGVSSGFRKAKVYEDYVSAIEDGFIPRSLDIADLVEHRVFQGERMINRKNFFDQMRGFRDETDGKPLVTDIPKRVIHRPDGTTDVQESVPIGYEAKEIMPGVRVAVHSGYAPLINALTATSQLAESGVVGTLADVAAINKHISLALDTFHASRTLQAELALTGKLSFGQRQKRGLALVEYRPQDLDLAVNKGLITQEMADWVRTRRPMEIEGRQVNLSPHALITLGAKSGLNMARIADVLYRDWIRELPVVGPVQKWVFDKMTRSAISQSFLLEFERAAKNNPHLNANQVARMVASDINVFFGNLQKESIFKNPSIRTFNNILWLASNWVEALATREIRAVKQLGSIPLDIARGKPVHVGTVAKGLGTGLAGYFAATQLLNLFTRGHFTFQNPEEGHKLDAWIPDFTGKTKGYFISPLSVFGEITHDILRLTQTKPDVASAITQIAHNKLGNLGRFIEVLALGRDPMTQDKILGTSRRAWKAAIQLAPVPIIGSQVAATVGHELFPQTFPATAPGAVQRQLFASGGVKMEPVGTAQTQVFHMVDNWKRASTNAALRAQVDKRLKEDFGPSDYKDLRTALVRDDLKDADKAYTTLLETKDPKSIRTAMAHPHPFTGSAKMERLFLSQITPEQRKTYDEAIKERQDLNRKFQEMLRRHYDTQRR